MRRYARDGLEWLQFEMFEALERHITHGIFTRTGGVSRPPFASLNASPTVGDDPADLAENLRRVRGALDGHPRLVTAIPAHTTAAIVVKRATLQEGRDDSAFLPRRGDILVTRLRAVGLYWAVGDCSAIFVVDPRHDVIALVHAGWRGTSRGIVQTALRMLHRYYGTDPSEVFMGIGPTIGPCCYQVGSVVRQAFMRDPLIFDSACFSTVLVPYGESGSRLSLRLDVAESNKRQAIHAGVPEGHIEVSGICTACNTHTFFSYRKEGGHTGRFACVLARK